MAQQLVTVGNVASDGTGDPLRDAFTKINENFTELYSGNVQITAANVEVYSVAGRTGNVVLNVNDISQAASKAYVNSSILTKANLSGAQFTGNVQSPWIITTDSASIGNIIVAGIAQNENVQQWANPAALFFGNSAVVPGPYGSRYYQINLQNKDPQGSGDFVITADDGNDGSNYINLSICGSLYNDPNYPTAVPHDGYLYMTGGNLNIWTSTATEADINFWTMDEKRLIVAANGQVIMSENCALYGNVSYTPNNAANYNQTITNIQQALDELAARLKTLGG